MAQVGRARLLQLLRGTRKPQESGSVSGSGDRALVANYSSPESETPDLMDTHSRFGSAMAFSTARAPPLSCCTLCRHSSEIRTGCANQRPSGSVRGAARNGCPYRDRQLTVWNTYFINTKELRACLKRPSTSERSFWVNSLTDPRSYSAREKTVWMPNS